MTRFMQAGKISIATISLLFVIANSATWAETSASSNSTAEIPKVRFSVVSVKENNSADHKWSYSIPLHGDSITYTNFPLFFLVIFSNDFHNQNLVFGMPEWTKDARYDIVAKVAAEDVKLFDSLTGPQRLVSFQDALADRFKLQFHRESRELPALELTVVKGGPKLREADPAKPLQLKKKYGQSILVVAPGNIEAEGVTMSGLASFLSVLQNNGLFVDKTGLTGSYDFTLRYAPQLQAVANESVEPSDAPVLPTALREQLGIGLKAGKAMFDCFVVDRIERPTPN